MANEHPILAEISALLAADDPRSVADLEHTLTTGYAAALELEGERWRLERELTRAAMRADERRNVRELARLARQIARTDAELVRLRALLATLRGRVVEARAA